MSHRNLNHEEVEHLRWKRFRVLNDGFVCLVDVMGDDSSVVQAARCSYGNDCRDFLPQEWYDIERSLGDGEYSHDERQKMRDRQIELERERETASKDNRTLIRYLMRMRHSTPFEMAEIKLLLRIPMDAWRQFVRHRTFSINEYSTRYTTAIDSVQTTEPDKWRCQATNNRQGSGDGTLQFPGHTGRWKKGEEDDTPEFPTPGHFLTMRERYLQEEARAVYEERIEAGVAREQARKDLPLCNYTEAYIKIDLHNMLHFLGLRMDSHAQQEIREYATVIGEQIVKPVFPEVWQAFIDYRLEAMQLTALDIGVIQRLQQMYRDIPPAAPFGLSSFADAQDPSWKGITKCRERDECLMKLQKLGIVASTV